MNDSVSLRSAICAMALVPVLATLAAGLSGCGAGSGHVLGDDDAGDATTSSGSSSGGTSSSGVANADSGVPSTLEDPVTTTCDLASCNGAGELCATCATGNCCLHPCPGQPCPPGGPQTSYCDGSGGVTCIAP